MIKVKKLNKYKQIVVNESNEVFIEGMREDIHGNKYYTKEIQLFTVKANAETGLKELVELLFEKGCNCDNN